MKVVLLVEDHPEVAAISKRHLAALGYTVEHASTGSMAWSLALKTVPDIVLLDLNLPDMHGYRLAEKMRADRRFDNTILAALTNFGLTGDAARSKAIGIDAHFRKPMDFAQLALVTLTAGPGASI
jgi:CheY-like chemotaxis protein